MALMELMVRFNMGKETRRQRIFHRNNHIFTTHFMVLRTTREINEVLSICMGLLNALPDAIPYLSKDMDVSVGFRVLENLSMPLICVAKCTIGATQQRRAMGLSGTCLISCLSNGNVMEDLHIVFQEKAKGLEETRVLTNFVSATVNSPCALTSIVHVLEARLLAKTRNVYGKTS